MESPATFIAAGRLQMTLCSYEYQSEIRYDYRVLHPQLDLIERGLEFQQAEQRKLYKEGVHFCPTCAGQELRNLGQLEEAGWLFDQSAFSRPHQMRR